MTEVKFHTSYSKMEEWAAFITSLQTMPHKMETYLQASWRHLKNDTRHKYNKSEVQILRNEATELDHKLYTKEKKSLQI